MKVANAGEPVSDDDLERFDWYVLVERINGVMFRFLQSWNPAGAPEARGEGQPTAGRDDDPSPTAGAANGTAETKTGASK